MTPASGSAYPLNTLVYLSENGSGVPGSSANYTFQNADDTANLSFSVPLTVSSAPATLQIIQQGGNVLYEGVTATVYRLGDAPA